MPYKQLTHNALIPIYDLNLTPLGGTVLRFCNYADTGGNPIIWLGIECVPYPIESTGFEQASSGKLPTPELRISNAFGAVSSLILQYDGLVGATIGRYLVFESDLDSRPGANPFNIQDSQVWTISRYSENKQVVTLTLKHALEMQGVRLPRRRVKELID